MFNDLLAMGAGSGGNEEVLLLYDLSSSVTLGNYYNSDYLTLDSGSFRPDSSSATSIEFTSKKSGTLKYFISNGSVGACTLKVNGNSIPFTSNVVGTTPLSVGDTITLILPIYYSCAVLSLET